jgi:hypothetical protein
MAVWIAARVMSAAGPSEIVLSDAMRDALQSGAAHLTYTPMQAEARGDTELLQSGGKRLSADGCWTGAFPRHASRLMSDRHI